MTPPAFHLETEGKTEAFNAVWFTVISVFPFVATRDY